MKWNLITELRSILTIVHQEFTSLHNRSLHWGHWPFGRNSFYNLGLQQKLSDNSDLKNLNLFSEMQDLPAISATLDGATTLWLSDWALFICWSGSLQKPLIRARWRRGEERRGQTVSNLVFKKGPRSQKSLSVDKCVDFYVICWFAVVTAQWKKYVTVTCAAFQLPGSFGVCGFFGSGSSYLHVGRPPSGADAERPGKCLYL